MLDKLKAVEARFEEVSERLTDAEIVRDQEQYKKLMREHKQLSPVVEKYRETLAVRATLAEA